MGAVKTALPNAHACPHPLRSCLRPSPGLMLALLALLAALLPGRAEIRRLKFTGVVPVQVQPSPLPVNWVVGHYEEIIDGDRFEAVLVYDDAIEDINDVTWASLGGYGEYPGAVKRIEITFFSPQGVKREIGAYASEGSALIMDRFTGAPWIPHQPAGGDYSAVHFAGGRKVGLAPTQYLHRHFLSGLILPGMSAIDIFLTHDQRHPFAGLVEGPNLAGGLRLGHALVTSQPGQTAERLNFLLHDPTGRTDDSKGGGSITLSLLTSDADPNASLLKRTVLLIQSVAEVAEPPTPSCPQLRPRGFVSPVFPEGQKEFELIIPEAPAAGQTITVPLGTFPAGIVTAPAGVTFQAGERRKIFTVDILPGNAGKSVTLRAGTADCYGLFTLGLEQVEQPRAVKLEFFPAEVEGGRPVIGLVTFDRPASADGGPEFRVNLSPDDGGTPPGVSGRLQPGARGAFFNLPTFPRTQTTTYTGEVWVSEAPTEIRGTLKVMPPAQPLLLESLTLNPGGVRETENSQATVRLREPAPAGGLELTVAASSGDASVPATVQVPAGQRQASFTVGTADVATVTLVEITARHGAETVSARLGIFPEAPRPVLLSVEVSPRKLTDAQSAIGTVTLSAAPFTQPAIVRLQTFSRDLIIPPEVQVPFGQTSASFLVESRLVSRETRAVITATLDGRSATAVVDLDPSLLPRIQSLSVADPVPAQGRTVTGRVQLDRTAPAGGSTVRLSGRPSDLLTVAPSVTVPAGESVVTFPVQVEADPLGESQFVQLDATLGNLTTTRRFLALGTDLAGRSTYAAFVAQQFPGQGQNPAVAGLDVVAPGQTLNNAQRYTFGDSGALTAIGQGQTAGGQPTVRFRFPWRVDAADLRLAVEAAADFGRWEELPGENVGLSIRGVSADGQFYTLEALIPQTGESPTALYRIVAEPLGAAPAP
jgi:hypothetical protein